MRSNIIKLLFICVTCGFMSGGYAQEGHPIKGSWIGEWESNDTHGEFILLVLDWDGNEITGIINPGTDNMEITTADLNAEDWSIVLEADGEKDGADVHYKIEASFENMELASRRLVGTWSSQNGNGDFEISRQ